MYHYVAVVIYCVSRIDGRPIVAIATLKTDNEKTGDMIQTGIPRDATPSQQSIRGMTNQSGGDCPLRGIIRDGRNRSRACYVQVRIRVTRAVGTDGDAGLSCFSDGHTPV